MSPQSKIFQCRPHPWHGLEIGERAPHVVNAYIEMTPFDAVKYEVDKLTGYMRVDRPQLTSSMSPTLYGFIPRTYCGVRVQAMSPDSTRGDGLPIDIHVITERQINRGEVILNARIIGGVQMVHDGKADDKIVAVLDEDAFWKDVKDIEQIPATLRDRLIHHCETYKVIPGASNQRNVRSIYGAERAKEVLKASQEDYDEMFGG